jgi:hypothetical protein
VSENPTYGYVLLVPVEGLPVIHTSTNGKDLLLGMGVKGLVRVTLGTDGKERATAVFTMDETAPVNSRATNVTAWLSGGSYVRTNGDVAFDILDSGIDLRDLLGAVR